MFRSEDSSVGITLAIVSAKNNKIKRRRRIHEERAWKMPQTLLGT
jgi:hypothetical protein